MMTRPSQTHDANTLTLHAISACTADCNPCVRWTWTCCDGRSTDRNGTLDADELSTAFQLLNVNHQSPAVRMLQTRAGVDGEKKVNLLEFSQLLKMVSRELQQSRQSKREQVARAHDLLRRAGTELATSESDHDKVTLLLKRGTRLIRINVHKGTMPFPLTRVPIMAKPATYVSTLTDAYELNYRYWECFECIRKATLVGVPIFLGPGRVMQLFTGLLVCVLCMVLYNSASDGHECAWLPLCLILPGCI